MDKIEVTRRPYEILRIAPNNTELLRITPTGKVIAPSLEAASEAGRYFVESMRGHLEVMREAIRAEVLATRTDATPVAWIDLLANAYAAGAEDVHKAWIEGTASSEPDFGEAANDYAHSIDFPPATDVAALVEALEWFLTGDKDVSGQALIYDGHWEQIATRIDNARQALAPFTKGQNDG